MPQYKLMLAKFPGNFSEHPRSSGWITATALECARNHPEIELFPWDKSDTPIPMVRNLSVLTAQELQIDYLLMIDNDMEPDPVAPTGQLLYQGARPFFEVAWQHMMKHRDTPCAIAAPYCGPSPWNNIYVFLWRNKSNDPRSLSLEQFSREEAALRCGVEEVAALPTGLCLYDMRVFSRLPWPWFEYEWKGDGPPCDKCGQPKPGPRAEKASTEDVLQTRNMSLLWYTSAGRRGGKVFCAWDSWARHIKLEHIDKPEITTCEIVAAQMREAIKTDLRQGEKLLMVESEKRVERLLEAANGRDDKACQEEGQEMNRTNPSRYQNTPERKP